MNKHVIRFGLSAREIGRAIKDLETYKQELARKTALLRERIADRIAQETQSGFTGAVVDDLVKGGKRYADVNVTVSDSGDVSIVIANGEDAVFVEFGAGVTHGGTAGTSPHPKGQELGFIIGGYGKGYGKRQIWGFYEDGELVLTRGTPPTMPLYNATRRVIDDIVSIAKEVFSQ